MHFYSAHRAFFFSFECRSATGFSITTLYTIGLKYSRHFFIQSEVKPKPIVTRLHTFSRASSLLQALTSSYDWLIGFSVSSADWPARLITLGLVLRRSVENRSNIQLTVMMFNDFIEAPVTIYSGISPWAEQVPDFLPSITDFLKSSITRNCCKPAPIIFSCVENEPSIAQAFLWNIIAATWSLCCLIMR